ncbi:MAG: lycopene cyclase domain-containing protein [Bacteroidetes bacterium]|nr:lycopene cyclase domain-containing protein [Bacteroidota bacterium]
MKFTYLWVDFFTVLVPFIFSFHAKLNFHKQFRYFFPANVLAAILFISWDILFTKIKVWGFNPDYISGVHIFNLPLEEILFFICVPFSCVFSYHCLNLYFKINWKPKTESVFVLCFSAILVIIGLLNYFRLYTSVTFVSLALLLLFLKYVMKVNWLPKLFSIYPILLLPFFIVNGILTGTGPDAPVVWYNNAENLGIRMLTIPVEDTFYGFELILLNVFFYEYLKAKFNPEMVPADVNN